MQDAIKEIIARHLGKVLINEKISNYTTYKVGGKVSAICFPKDENDLIEILKLLKEKKIKHFILGNGSNVLFSDDLYDGIIIKLDCFDTLEFNDNTINSSSTEENLIISNNALLSIFKHILVPSGEVLGPIQYIIFIHLKWAFVEVVKKRVITILFLKKIQLLLRL